MSGKHQRIHARDDAGRKLHCKRGHDMTDSYVRANGSRVCRWCKRIMDRKHFYLDQRLRRSSALPTTECDIGNRRAEAALPTPVPGSDHQPL